MHKPGCCFSYLLCLFPFLSAGLTGCDPVDPAGAGGLPGRDQGVAADLGEVGATEDTGAAEQADGGCPDGACRPYGYCTAHEQCLPAEYCDRTRSRCVLDRGDGAACTADPECQAGLVCLRGVCHPPDWCSGDDQCPPASHCDEAASRCIGDGDVGAACREESDCQAELVCLDGTCRPLDWCEHDGHCAADQHCDEPANRCLPDAGAGEPCADASECQAGLLCLDGHCQLPGWCGGAALCPEEQHCDLLVHRCVDDFSEGTACLDDGECVEGLVCRFGACHPPAWCERDNMCEEQSHCDTPTFTCVDDYQEGEPCRDTVECAGELVCLEGACHPRDWCRDDRQCPPEAFCDVAQGRCRPDHLEGDPCRADAECIVPLVCFRDSCRPVGWCTEDEHCPQGQHCDPDLSRCVADQADGGPCETARDCADGLVCKHDACHSPAWCRADEDCPPGAHCAEELSTCVADLGEGGECEADEECQDDLRCRLGFCRGPDWCSPDFPCPEGLFCDELHAVCQPLVEEGGPCGGAAECQAGLQCLRGACRAPDYCETDLDCPAEQHCDPEQLRCVPDREANEPCEENRECAADLVCVGGFCHPVGWCELAEHCPPGFHCDEAEQRCVADRGLGEPCLAADECQDGLQCLHGFCRLPGYCEEEADCGPDEHCLEPAFTCLPDEGEGGSCQEHEDCQTGLICLLAACHPPDWCSLIYPCPAGRHCVLATERCVDNFQLGHLCAEDFECRTGLLCLAGQCAERPPCDAQRLCPRGDLICCGRTCQLDSLCDFPWLAGQFDPIVQEEGLPIPPRPVSVGDQGPNPTPAAELVLLTSSSDSDLLPPPEVEGVGEQRTLTFAPVAGRTGETRITLRVLDREAHEVEASFTVTITPIPPTRPTISAVPPLRVAFAEPLGSLTVTVGDAGRDATPPEELEVTATSSNEDLLEPPRIAAGDTPQTRRLTFLPPRGAGHGTAFITLTVRDHTDQTASTEFEVSVAPPPATAPWVRPVPDVQAVVGQPLDPIILTVGDDGANATPPEELEVLAFSGNLQLLGLPEVAEGGVAQERVLQLAPVAARTGSAEVVVLVTDAQLETGYTRFLVTITPPPSHPVISPVEDLIVAEGTPLPPLTVTVADQGAEATPAAELVLTATSDRPDRLPAPRVTPGEAPGERILLFQPVPGQVGEVNLLLTVTDSAGETGVEPFRVTIVPGPDQGPIFLGELPDLEYPLGAAIEPIPVLVRDAGAAPTPAAELEVRATATPVGASIFQIEDEAGGLGTEEILLPADDPVGAPEARTLVLVPAAGQLGAALITLVATDGDGRTATRQFRIAIVDPDNPPPELIPFSDGALEDRTINQGSKIQGLEVRFTDCNWAEPCAGGTLCDQLVTRITSSNPEVIPDAAIVRKWDHLCFHNVWGSYVLDIVPPPDRYGESTITISVTDGGGRTTSRSFTVRVNALPVVSNLPADPWGYNGNCPQDSPRWPFTVTDPDGGPAPLTVTVKQYGWDVDGAKTIVRQRAGSTYEYSIKTHGGFWSDRWVDIDIFDGLGHTSQRLDAFIYVSCPSLLRWVQVPETILPGGIRVPAFTTDMTRLVTHVVDNWTHAPTAAFDDAVNRCRQFGPDYHLLTDRQWLALAQQVLRVPENWTGVGETIPVAGVPTHVLTGWGAEVGLPLRGSLNNWWVPTYDYASWDWGEPIGYVGSRQRAELVPGITGTVGADQRRTWLLPSGDFLFDLVGQQPTFVWCDDDNPVCDRGRVRAGQSYTGLPSAVEPRPLDDPGITRTWLLPPASLRNNAHLGRIIETFDDATPLPLVRGGHGADSDQMGLYSLSHRSWGNTGYRCAGPADAPGIVTHTRPTLTSGPIPDQVVQLGDELQVPLTLAADAKFAVDRLRVRAFKTPGDGLPVTVSGAGANRVITFRSRSAGQPTSRTATVVIHDPAGAATTATFLLHEVENAAGLLDFAVTPPVLEFNVPFDSVVPLYDDHLVTLTNTGTLPIQDPFRVTVPGGLAVHPVEEQPCPTAANGRYLYPGQQCQFLVRVVPEQLTAPGTWQDTLRFHSPGIDDREVITLLHTWCNRYTRAGHTPEECQLHPVPCTGPECAFTCISGGCTLECDGPGCDFTCAGGGCTFLCPAGGCTTRCPAGKCTTFCPGGGCEIECAGGGCTSVCPAGECTETCAGRNCYSCTEQDCECPDCGPNPPIKEPPLPPEPPVGPPPAPPCCPPDDPTEPTRDPRGMICACDCLSFWYVPPNPSWLLIGWCDMLNAGCAVWCYPGQSYCDICQQGVGPVIAQ